MPPAFIERQDRHRGRGWLAWASGPPYNPVVRCRAGKTAGLVLAERHLTFPSDSAKSAEGGPNGERTSNPGVEGSNPSRPCTIKNRDCPDLGAFRSLPPLLTATLTATPTDTNGRQRTFNPIFYYVALSSGGEAGEVNDLLCLLAMIFPCGNGVLNDTEGIGRRRLIQARLDRERPGAATSQRYVIG
jgi:hypothetical protein